MIKGNLPLELMSQKLNCQLHCVQKNLKNGAYHVDNLGSILPAAVIMHDLEEREPMGVHYMNDWGCERLGTSANEVNALGDEYYEKYFLKEETIRIFIGMAQYLQNGDPSQ